MKTSLLYLAAAFAEIGGCFAVWLWWREGKSMIWIVPGLALLTLFAWLLALVPANAAARTYAAYGGVYVAASLVWLWLVEGQMPGRTDLIGAVFTLIGAVIILTGALRS
ncbi:MAG: YnfA family protein [Deltaproteobacteria bacterium]